MIQNVSKDEWEFKIIREGVPVWGCPPLPPLMQKDGPYYVSFDKKTIYNLWGDSDKLSQAQKSLLKQAIPTMWRLTCDRH